MLRFTSFLILGRQKSRLVPPRTRNNSLTCSCFLICSYSLTCSYSLLLLPHLPRRRLRRRRRSSGDSAAAAAAGFAAAAVATPPPLPLPRRLRRRCSGGSAAAAATAPPPRASAAARLRRRCIRFKRSLHSVRLYPRYLLLFFHLLLLCHSPRDEAVKGGLGGAAPQEDSVLGSGARIFLQILYPINANNADNHCR